MKDSQDKGSVDSFSTTGSILESEFGFIKVDNCFIKLFFVDAAVALLIKELEFIVELV